jgi:phytoene synthase
MDARLSASYEHCCQVARTRARNFYYSFLLLPEAKREAMCAIYAFMRQCDDLSDEPDAGGTPARRARMDRWRADLDTVLAGGKAKDPSWPALADTVVRYRIPHQYLYEMIEGVGSDIEPRPFATFDELYRYCYRVASVVGLTIVHIFGFEERNGDEVRRLAEACGVAFQLTNILRDVEEDARLGRCYLPVEDLERFGVDPARLAYDAKFVELMRFEGARARDYYRQAEPLPALIDRSGRTSLRALIAIYSTLLKRIEARRYNVLAGRIRLSGFEKTWIMLRTAAGF